MALFEYLALAKSGRKIKSIIHAENLLEAKEILSAKQILAFKIKKIKKEIKPLSKKEVLDFFIDLKNLLSSSLPLYEALMIISEKTQNRKIKFLILDICENIKNGQSFSSSLKKHKKSFDLIICSMIENAQKTGGFVEAIDEIIKILEKTLNLKKQIVASLTYPAILLTFCFVILSALFFFIIPSLFDLFSERNMHPFTKFVINTSKFLCANKALILIGIFSLLSFIFSSYMIKSLRERVYEKILMLPYIKPFMIKLSLIRFCRSFALLLIGGESYVSSLKLAKNVLNHPPLEKEIGPMEDQLIEGKHLSELLKNSSLIPQDIPQMLVIAEETAQMPNILLNIAKIYEEEIQKTTAKLTSLLQPIILMVLGVIIGFVVLSVLLPLTDVSSFIGG